MFKHLLVPLDGSRLAEAALGPAGVLAQRLGASVLLLHLVEQGAPSEVHGERHLTTPEEAAGYLQEVAARALPAGVPVESHVHTAAIADVAAGIADHALELGADLVVMCTHGRSGLRELLLGSIAQQVVALDAVPVLLVRPADDGSAPQFACRRIVVPLDGRPEHEEGLPVAASLASGCGAGLFLVVVVPTAGTLPGEHAATGVMLPATTRMMLQMAEEEARAYLGGQIAALRAQGLSTEGEVRRGEASEAICETVRRAGGDMVVLGTHGRTGMDAFWARSTAPRVSRRVRTPLLLVPLPKNVD